MYIQLWDGFRTFDCPPSSATFLGNEIVYEEGNRVIGFLTAFCLGPKAVVSPLGLRKHRFLFSLNTVWISWPMASYRICFEDGPRLEILNVGSWAGLMTVPYYLKILHRPIFFSKQP